MWSPCVFGELPHSSLFASLLITRFPCLPGAVDNHYSLGRFKLCIGMKEVHAAHISAWNLYPMSLLRVSRRTTRAPRLRTGRSMDSRSWAQYRGKYEGAESSYVYTWYSSPCNGVQTHTASKYSGLLGSKKGVSIKYMHGLNHICIAPPGNARIFRELWSP